MEHGTVMTTNDKLYALLREQAEALLEELDSPRIDPGFILRLCADMELIAANLADGRSR